MNEVLRRKDPMNRSITEVDPSLFSSSLTGWLEVTAHVMAQRAGKAQPNPDGSIPPLSKSDLNTTGVKTIADDSIFAFGIASALKADKAAFDKVEKDLVALYGENFPGSFAFWHFKQEPDAKPETLEDHIGMIGKTLMEDGHFEPKDTWNAGVRFLEKIRKSNFKVELVGPLAAWVRQQWTTLSTQLKSQLVKPEENVPPIKEALADERNDESFIAALLLASMAAVDQELTEDYQGFLKSIARRV
ncbi:hypothetical protein [Methylocapsa acidiphila]|uniref:hypothetical protein n=1 Tax=Methylocapsa acidiphila TaxID=133552 RepID=UPI0004174996|nr:hypothetical protein [Methylocapsa acidiphila]